MKVVYTDKDRYRGLTIGKTYEFIREVINANITQDSDRPILYILIINDNGYERWYPKKCFKLAVSEMRNDKINKLLEDES